MSKATPLYPEADIPLRSWGFDPSIGLMPSQHAQLLVQQPEKYSEMVESVTAFGIYMIDRRGIIRSWNRGAENITGFPASEVIGQKLEVLFPEDGVREGAVRRILEFVRSNHHCKDEQKRRLRGGGEFLAQTSLDAVRNSTGELLGFVEVFQDVTAAKQREERQYRRATRDELTELFNRGHFMEMASVEVERARRFAEPLSLVLIDIDNIRRINDTYGFDVGDRVLVAAARCCTAAARKIDLLARIGGEEFCLLLPRANKQPAMEFAQRLRVALGEQRIPLNGGREIAFTASMGIASLRPTTRDLNELLRNADAALVSAKRQGRNCVKAWFE